MTPPPERDPTVVALGREVQRLTRSHTAVEQRIGDLEGLLQQLATDVTTLVSRAAPDGDEAVRAWLLTAAPKTAVGDLTDLAEWLPRVYLRYPDAVLPSCWLWHPALIEELRWLRAAHQEAYDEKRSTWAKVADWHDRHRPGVARRLRDAYGSCELREHTEGGAQRKPAPTVALAALADLAARAWAIDPSRPLLPSDQQIHEAEQHDAAQNRSTYA